MPFPIGGPLEPSLSLPPLDRYLLLHTILNEKWNKGTKRIIVFSLHYFTIENIKYAMKMLYSRSADHAGVSKQCCGEVIWATTVDHVYLLKTTDFWPRRRPMRSDGGDVEWTANDGKTAPANVYAV